MELPSKPQPTIDAWAAPYWQAAREGRLLIQQCPACGRFIFYPRQHCPFCDCDHPAWVESAGFGTVYSFTVVENNAPSAFASDMPFVIAVIQLDEGVRMLTNVVGCHPSQVSCDLPVQVVFEPLNDAVTLPKFKPRGM